MARQLTSPPSKTAFTRGFVEINGVKYPVVATNNLEWHTWHFNFYRHVADSTNDLTSSTTSAADSLVIPVTHRYVAKTTGIDAEALTLANGSAGQVLTINLGTDGGGDGTLTPATATGWATIVFSDAGDSANLEYVDDTVGWIITGCYGLTAQPVITV